MADARPWVTPSDLAEYTFCPRALHYRRTRDDPGSKAVVRGSTYHTRRLSTERWRETHGHLAWAVVALGVGLVVVAVVVGGL